MLQLATDKKSIRKFGSFSGRSNAARVSMEVSNYVVSKLAYFTYLGDSQPTYKGVIIHLLSTMDIQAGVKVNRFSSSLIFPPCRTSGALLKPAMLGGRWNKIAGKKALRTHILLVGGFNHVLFSPLFREDSHFH